MSSLRFTKPLLATALVLALAACKSDEQRADDYFQSGMELLEEGDTDRALVQFRNVFEFDPGHLETREAMANLFMKQRRPRAAFRQFLVIAEQYPENVPAHVELAEISFTTNSWEAFDRYGSKAVELAPQRPRVQAIDLGLQYRAAALDEDEPARQALVAPSEALLADLPRSQILNNLLIDSYARDGELGKAIERIDVMLAATPRNRQLYNRRLALLAQMQDADGLETQLRDMVERFPKDDEMQGMLLRFYVSQQRLDEAEAFLREIAQPTDEDPGRFISLIQFVSEVKGDEAGRAEIQRGIDESPNPNRFKAMMAMLDFQAGGQTEAIAEMEAILVDADPVSDDTHAIKVTLARMLIETGNQVGARRQVEEVLAQNSSNVEALKMQASWQLLADDVEDALANLRVALDTAPEDVQVMNLMHEAYARLGDADLAREFLAMAVDASGNGPEESLRYARLLMQEGRLLPAEDVLLPALRQDSDNVEILGTLGTLYLQLDDIPRANQVIDTLRRIDSAESNTLANDLQVEALNRESGTEEALEFLEELAGAEGANLRAQLVLLQAQLQTGNTAEALTLAEELATERPQNMRVKQALAMTQMAAGDVPAAKTSFEGIIEAAPAQAVRAWIQLAQIHMRQGNPDLAETTLDEALEATGQHPSILWIKASRLERAGEIDAAIDIYETLYELNPAALVIANNLASMLVTYKEDAESLERAWAVGRRLRDVDVPPVQDTYGWLLFRRGQIQEALPYLETAAAGLPSDPVVQVHLGRAYVALDRPEEALQQMQKAVDIAGPADTRPQIVEARSEITRLRSSLAEN